MPRSRPSAHCAVRAGRTQAICTLTTGPKQSRARKGRQAWLVRSHRPGLSPPWPLTTPGRPRKGPGVGGGLLAVAARLSEGPGSTLSSGPSPPPRWRVCALSGPLGQPEPGKQRARVTPPQRKLQGSGRGGLQAAWPRQARHLEPAGVAVSRRGREVHLHWARGQGAALPCGLLQGPRRRGREAACRRRPARAGRRRAATPP